MHRALPALLAFAVAVPLLYAQAPPARLDAPEYLAGPNVIIDLHLGTLVLPSSSTLNPCTPGTVDVAAGNLWFCNSGGTFMQVGVLNTSGYIPANELPTINLLTGTLTAGQLPSLINANTTGNAATATALATVPTQCGTGLYEHGSDVSGNASCAQVQAAQIGGLAPSATTDTTNAANISSGVFGVSRLPASVVLNTQVNTFANQSAPGTPASGFSSVWVDGSDRNLKTKNELGVTTITVQPQAAVSHQWVSAIASNGGITMAQPAATDVSGLSTSATIDATNASNLSSGTVPVARLPVIPAADIPLPTLSTLGGVLVVAPVTHQWVTSINASGAPQLSQPAATDISGLAASATTDTTNANNITSGTLPAARVPVPTLATLGGVEANNITTHQWVDSIPTTGIPHTSQPAAADISGLATSATVDTTNAGNLSSGTLPSGRLPVPSATTLGGIESITTVSHQWIASISTSGVPVLSQPAATDISGLAASATIDTTNASNITSGTLPSARLPGSVLQAGQINTLTDVAAPGSPPALGAMSLWADSTDKNMKAENDTGAITVTVKPLAFASHLFVTALGSNGTLSAAQPAATDISGLATSATTDTTNASNISSGTLNASRLPATVNVSNLGNAATATALAATPTQATSNQYCTGVDIHGNCTSAGVTATQVSGLATSATVDATNATNISAGTLNAARLPATVLQNTGSYSDPTWLTGLSSAKLIGIIASGNLPAPTSLLIGGVKAGANITIASDGTISAPAGGTTYTLPAATVSVLGGVIPSTGLAVNGSGVETVLYGTTSGTAAQGNDTRVANAVQNTGSYTDPAWITTLSGAKLTGTVPAAVLPAPAGSALGAVKAGANIAIASDGTISTSGSGYVLPAATGGALGGVIASTGLNVTGLGALTVAYGTTVNTATQGNDARVVNAVQTTSTYSDPSWLTGLGAGKVIGTLASTSLPAATSSALGGVSIAGTSGLSDVSGAIAVVYGASVNTSTQGNDTRVVNAVQATAAYADPTWISTLNGSKLIGTVPAGVLPAPSGGSVGAVKAGANIAIASDGTISTGAPYSLAIATATTLGGVIPQTGLTVNGSGDVSVNYGTTGGTATQGNDARVVNAVETTNTYSDPTWLLGLSATKLIGLVPVSNMPIATGIAIGAVKAGANITIASDGTISSSGGGSGYTLPASTGSTLGGVITSTGLNVTGLGALTVVYGTTTGTSVQGNDTRVVNAVQTSSSYFDPSWLTGLSATKLTGTIASGNLPAPTSVLIGAVKAGTNITIAGDGTISSTGGGGGGGGTAPGSFPFTSQTSVAMAHNLGTLNVVVACYDNQSPAHQIIPGSVVLTDSNDLTVNFSGSQSGRCVINGGVGPQGVPGSGAGITGMSGDVTASGSSGTVGVTLATVNSNVGTFGNSTTVPIITVNGKGLITGVTTAAISGGGGGGGVPVGALGSIPGTCSVGQLYFANDIGGNPNQQLYSCSSTNTWTKSGLIGSSGALNIDSTGALDIVTTILPRLAAANTFTGLNTFSVAPGLPQSTPGSSSAACTAGTIWSDTGFLYICTALNTIKRATLSSF